MVVADKGYCTKEAQKTMWGKNRDKDRFFTKLHMPYKGIFSKMSKQVKYRGIAKVQFQAIIQAFVHNLKRLIKIEAPPLIFSLLKVEVSSQESVGKLTFSK